MTGWAVVWDDPNGSSWYVADAGDVSTPDINKAFVYKRKRDALEYVLDDEHVVKVKWTRKKVRVA